MVRRLDYLWLCTVESGTVKIRTTLDDGATTPLALTIGTGTHGALCWSKNGILYVYRLHSGTVYGRSYDSGLNALEAEWTTNLTGIDDASIAARVSVSNGRISRIGIQYTVGGDLMFSTSNNGKVFS